MYVMELYFFSKKTLLYGLRFYRGMIFWTIDHHQIGHLGKKIGSTESSASSRLQTKRYSKKKQAYSISFLICVKCENRPQNSLPKQCGTN